MSLRAAVLSCLFLASCVAAPDAARRSQDPARLPQMRLPAPIPATAPARSNAEMARDILDLVFRLESGRDLPVLTRFEGPITLRVTGRRPPSLEHDLGSLIARLGTEAGIAIAEVPPSARANITVALVPGKSLRRTVPEAACFVVPNATSWSEFRKGMRGTAQDWGDLTTRETIAVFLPDDAPPQELRDCLHEELAQALGPLNDLYRLPDSVFNDDNFRTVLTGFDMLVLKAIYDPALGSGLTEAEVAERLPAILRRLNPAGERSGPDLRSDTSRAWIGAIESALGSKGSDGARRAGARRAVDLARAAGWRDHRLAFSYFALARVSANGDPETALEAYLAAARVYGADPATHIHAAHVGAQLAAFTLSAGRPEAALRIVERHIDTVRKAENASLLATLLLIRSGAEGALGDEAAAAESRDEALGWARYGYGEDAEVRRRAGEIAAIGRLSRATPG